MNRVFYFVSSILIIFLLLKVFQEFYWSRANSKIEQSITLEHEPDINLETLKWLSVYMPPSIAVLIHSCVNTVVFGLIEQLITERSSKDEFVVIVIQHCWHEESMQWLKNFENEIHILHGPQIYLPDEYEETAYNHFWALNVTFQKLRFENVVVLNNYKDISVSVDFESYFKATMELLEKDPSIWCISGYNDNGREDLIDTTAHHTLHRTEFFSGVVWMTSKAKWKEFGTKEWPKVYFRDWIRDQIVVKTLSCVRPEVSRVKFISSDKDFNDSQGSPRFETHSDDNYLNYVNRNFPESQLSQLKKRIYDFELIKTVDESVGIDSLKDLNDNQSLSLRITYKNDEEFSRIADELGIVSYIENGVAPNSYKGIVTTMYKAHRVYLVPSCTGGIKKDLFGYK